MDPNQTYLDIIDAMGEEDHETARGLALALKRWIASGGFVPEGYTKEEIEGYVARILEQTAFLND